MPNKNNPMKYITVTSWLVQFEHTLRSHQFTSHRICSTGQICNRLLLAHLVPGRHDDVSRIDSNVTGPELVVRVPYVRIILLPRPSYVYLQTFVNANIVIQWLEAIIHYLYVNNIDIMPLLCMSGGFCSYQIRCVPYLPSHRSSGAGLLNFG